LDFRFPFRLLTLFPILAVQAISCGDIPRDNPLDPKNPEGFRERKVMVEAFVNTENPLPYNHDMLAALDSLKTFYPNRIVIAEFHRNTKEYADRYHLNENELLYNNYLTALGSNLKGVPDVFINGIDSRVQGASGIQSALFRLQEKILPKLSTNCYFTLEVSYLKNGGKITPKVTLARLGRKDATSIVLRAVLIARINESDLRRVVRGSARSGTISRLAHGESRTVTLPELSLDISFPNRLIIIVTDKNEREIFQCEEVKVN